MTDIVMGRHTSTFSRSKNAVTARQRLVIELAALGMPLDQMAKRLGSVRVDTVQDLLRRALAAQAEHLREEGAWEAAYVLHMRRLDMLMEKWMPLALAGDEKAADKVDKWLTHYERVQGLAAPERLQVETTVEERDHDAARAAVLMSLMARSRDIQERQNIIDGQAVEAEAEEA